MNRTSESEAAAPAPQTVAAVDLGSNSFHMIVVRDDGGKLHYAGGNCGGVRGRGGKDTLSAFGTAKKANQ